MNEIRATGPARSPSGVKREGPSEFTGLAQIIRDSGLLRRRYGYYWAKLIAAPVVLGLCLTAFVWIGDTWWQMFTAAVLGIVLTQIAFLGHDAAHRQIFVSGKWNDWACLVIGDLLVGMSYGWWQHKHTRHHANPNKLGADPDIELPVIVVTAEAAAVPRPAVISWLRSHQGLFFFPILLLEGISLHASGVRRVFVREHLNRRWVEIGFIGIRLIGYGVLVFFVLSPGVAVAFLAVQLGVFGFYMGASFAPNHKGMPIVPRDMTLDFLHRQVTMSRNIRGSRVLDTVMGGLNYQIEHHLFPSMPRPHLRAAAPMIAAYCREHDIPYTQTGLFSSYAIIVRYINRVGLGERDVFTCPLVDQRRHLTAGG
ncbi:MULTISPECIES: acyl-CoA desaturase [unclassified Microbacterium]|uniref:fatty acid desaturase family protein n=1 Tax=unclassified Microbacterium TaxID=2609290 RepID=UPI00214AEAB1|nr:MULTISPECIES: acyl-CoA desaturase [unclassified Microbacterium]MCR2785930.1 acyl-CoA desaturase [Microbacterium sp. zg.B96]WIM17096.1 acyl-CoA desaturase [Microbacterium sp. zg-B96]